MFELLKSCNIPRRDDFDVQFVSMFMLLLFLKCFHWLCIDRVEYVRSS